LYNFFKFVPCGPVGPRADSLSLVALPLSYCGINITLQMNKSCTLNLVNIKVYWDCTASIIIVVFWRQLLLYPFTEKMQALFLFPVQTRLFKQLFILTLTQNIRFIIIMNHL